MSPRARALATRAAMVVAAAGLLCGGVLGRRSLGAAWQALLHPELVEQARSRGDGPSQCGVLDGAGPELDAQLSLDFDPIDPLALDDPDAAVLSGLTPTDLPVSVTRRTLRFVRFFAQDLVGRKVFRERLRRSGLYRQGIEQQLREAGLPEDLVWVAAIESSFDPQAVSPAGAAGMWQFMPETAALYGLTITPWLDERRSLTRETEAAVTHFRDLFDRLGSWELALAAYNMGYDGLLHALQALVEQRGRDGRAGPGPSFADLAKAQLLPAETADYVPKVAAFAIVAANRARFDHDDVPPDGALRLASLAVPEGTPLRTVGRAAGLSLAELKELNPELLRERVPTDGGDYLLTVPAERMEQARAALPAYLDHEVLEVAGTDAVPAMPAPMVLGASGDEAVPTPAAGTRRPAHLGPNRLPAFPVPGRSRADPFGVGGTIVTLDADLPRSLTGIDIGWQHPADPMALLRGAERAHRSASGEPELDRQLAFLSKGPAARPSFNPFEEQRLPNGVLLRTRHDPDAARVAIGVSIAQAGHDLLGDGSEDAEVRYAHTVSRRNVDVGLQLAAGRLAVLLGEASHGPLAALRGELEHKRRDALESEPFGKGWIALSTALFASSPRNGARLIGPTPPTGPDMTRRLLLASLAEERSPERVTISLVGNFDQRAAMVQLRRALDELSVPARQPPEPDASAALPRQVVHARVPHPRTLYGWLGPATGSKEALSLEVAVQLLAGSKESRFRRELLDREIASAARGFVDPGWPSSVVALDLAPTGPVPIESLERRVDAMLEDLRRHEPSLAEVAYAKAILAYRLRKRVAQSLEPPSTDLAEASLPDRVVQTLRPGLWERSLKLLDEVTPAAVHEAIRANLRPDTRRQVVVEPE